MSSYDSKLEPSIDDDFGAAHEAILIGDEECGGFGQLLDAAEPLHRALLDVFALAMLRQALRHALIQKPRCEQVDLDSVTTDLARESFREPAQRRFRSCIVDRRLDDSLRSEIADAQDVSALLADHVAERGATDEVRALDVHVHH